MEPGIRVLNQYRVPNYSVPERAVAALAAMSKHRHWRERPPLQMETFGVDRDCVRQLFDQVRAERRLAIGDTETREILEAYGIPTPTTLLARAADEAVRHADRIGFPVALKIASPDIPHKTDVGGVRLNVMSRDDVRESFDLMIYRASRYVPDADIWGCLVQEMVHGGKEVIVGMNCDPDFGPVMTFALGGIFGEVLQDVAVRVVPFDRRDAREMVREIRGHSLLQGVRGDQRSDLGAVVETLLRLAQLVSDFPEITEFDINPLTLFEEGKGLVGIDMRLVLS
jgi:acetyltransferase